jgi:hypothetical protein
MKIPQEIFGKNKIRDGAICKLYSEDYSPEEIKTIRNLPISVRRIEQIVYKNRSFVKVDKEWAETKQIHRINRRIKKAPESKRDVYDWEVLLDSKIAPKKSESGNTSETKIIIIRDGNQTQNSLGLVRDKIELGDNIICRTEERK